MGALAAAWLSHYPLAAFGPPRRAYALYSTLQFSPLLVAVFWGVVYYRRMRAAARGRKIRTAQLEVRRLFDFVPPALFATAVASYVAATALLLYLPEGRGWRLDGGFTGWVSLHRPIVFMTIVDMLGAGGFVRAYLRKQDPHQTHEDRARQIRLVAQIWLVVTIFLSVLVAGNKILWAFRLYEYIVPLGSLYFQAVATSSFWLSLRFNPFLRLEPESFEAYKADTP